MTEPVATLTVDGSSLQLAGARMVRIDGDLPNVDTGEHGIAPDRWRGKQIHRPLRVGDRVTLATCAKVNAMRSEGVPSALDPECQDCIPFATATVADVIRSLPFDGSKDYYVVTVTDVEVATATVADVIRSLPFDGSKDYRTVTVTDVEEL